MQKAQKRYMGFGGLALVAAITTVAYYIPTPSAGAVSAGAEAEINVVVYSSDDDTKIQTPSDGDVFTSSIIKISNIHTNAVRISYYLRYGDATGDGQLIKVITPADPTSVDNFTINLADYGYGEFKLTAVMLGENGGTYTDAVEFSYIPIKVNSDTTDTTTKDPVFNFSYDAGVGSITFQAYSKATGQAILDAPITYTVESTAEAGTGQITLPFASYGMDSGSYYLVATAYKANQPDSSPIYYGVTYDFTYTKPGAEPTPNTDVAPPNTGDITIGDLTISRTDFLVTGLVAFGIITAVALFLLNRKSNRRSRR